MVSLRGLSGVTWSKSRPYKEVSHYFVCFGAPLHFFIIDELDIRPASYHPPANLLTSCFLSPGLFLNPYPVEYQTCTLRSISLVLNQTRLVQTRVKLPHQSYSPNLPWHISGFLACSIQIITVHCIYFKNVIKDRLKLVSMRKSTNMLCPHSMQHMLIRTLNLPYLIFVHS